MNIEINTMDILFNVKNVSHLESATIPDADLRYKVEAGTDKSEEIYRCIENAEATLRLQFDRFLMRVNKTENINGEPEKYEYTFVDSLRRQEFREDSYKELISQALVSLTLAEYYQSVNQIELAQKHSAEAQANFMTTEKMFFDKRAPKVPNVK